MTVVVGVTAVMRMAIGWGESCRESAPSAGMGIGAPLCAEPGWFYCFSKLREALFMQ